MFLIMRNRQANSGRSVRVPLRASVLTGKRITEADCPLAIERILEIGESKPGKAESPLSLFYWILVFPAIGPNLAKGLPCSEAVGGVIHAG